MKISLLNILLLLLVSFSTFSQEIVWSKKIDPSPGTICLIPDNRGNVYNFGVYYGGIKPIPGLDTAGYVLQKIDSSGKVIFQRTWKFPYHIKKMVIDADNNLFFTGNFTGKLSIDGFSIVSKGDYDGMVGKMDSNGTLLWINTFGGSKFDVGYGICLDIPNNKVYVTGQTHDSLYINNSFVQATKESMLLAVFDMTNGSFLKSKLIGNYPELNNGSQNKGLEITIDSKGFLFVLEERKGKTSDMDTSNMPINKAFINKMSQNFDTLWSKEVTTLKYSESESSASNLTIAENGDIYVLTHYHSNRTWGGSFIGLNNVSGNNFVPPNSGSYVDLLIVKNTIYLLGSNADEYISGPGHPIRYSYIVKIAQQKAVGFTRIYDGYFNRIVINSFSDFYAIGNYTKPIVIGKDSLKYFNPINSYYFDNGFMSKIKDINCTSVDIHSNASSIYGFPYFICQGASSSLFADAGLSNYLWSDGQPGQNIKVTKPGNYVVSAVNADGCRSYSYALTFQMKPNKITFTSVSYDSQLDRTGINIQSEMEGTKYYKIFKESTPNKFVFSDTANAYLRSYYISTTDKSSAFQTQAIRYYVTSVDTCGNESAPGKIQRTMFLSVSKSATYNKLEWNRYEGFQYLSHTIFRGTNRNNLTELVTVDSSVTSFVDTITNGINYFYEIKIFRNPYGSNSQSNITDAKVTTGIQNLSENETIKIIPNPFSESFSIHSQSGNDFDYQVINPIGQIIKSGKSFGMAQVDINLNGETPGLYIVKIKIDERDYFQKILKN
jgi:hypothetical protein